MTQTWDDLKGSDVIDSRDIIERMDDLGGCDDAGETIQSLMDRLGLDEDDAQELAALAAVNEEGDASFEDWRYGVALVRDDYFEDYAEQFAEDIGAINRDASWPLTYIDWERAAAALRQDYTSIDIDGTTYWGR